MHSEFMDFGQLLVKSEHLCKDDTQYSLAVVQGETLVKVKKQHNFCPCMNICFFDFFGSLP